MNFLSIENEENNFLQALEIDKKFVMQHHDWDCGVACLAMILNKNYEEVFVDFQLKSKSCNNINQKGISFASLKVYLENNNQVIEIKNKNELDIQLLPNQVSRNESYLIILKKNEGFTHFCFIYDKILYDPEQGVVVLDDAIDFQEYLTFSKFTKFKYLSKIINQTKNY
jgi:predicted double-glycine peptidase